MGDRKRKKEVQHFRPLLNLWKAWQKFREEKSIPPIKTPVVLAIFQDKYIRYHACTKNTNYFIFIQIPPQIKQDGKYIQRVNSPPFHKLTYLTQQAPIHIILKYKNKYSKGVFQKSSSLKPKRQRR